MAISNINSIQRTEDLEFIKQTSNEYLLQSLANLGQRLAVKGDSVTTKYFTFGELLGNVNYSSTKFVGKVSKANDNSIIISAVDKNTLTTLDIVGNTVGTSTTIDFTNDYVITSSIIELSTVINGVTSYDSKGKIYVSENYYTFMFKGLDNEGNIKEIICEQIDKVTNAIVSSIRIIKYNNKLYLLYCNLLSTDASDNSLKYKGIWNITNEFSNDIINDKLLKISNYLFNDFLGNVTPESILLDNIISVNFPTVNSTTTLSYNSSDIGFKFDELTTPEQLKTVEGLFNYFSYDLTYLYRYIKEYYSNVVFNEDNLQFKKQIVANIFKAIINNSTKATEIYLSLDYIFNYMCNSNNNYQIYYNTNLISAKYVELEITPQYILQCKDLSNNILCWTDSHERISTFNYDVVYDNENSNTVYGISVTKQYTLPYVGGEGTWIINEEDSKINANGKNAGNPNIIIVESHSNYYNIVSGANKQNLLEKLKWSKEIAYIEPLEKINLDKVTVSTLYNYFKVNCWVPNLSSISLDDIEEWKELIKNSIILNISTIDCIDYSNNVNYDYNKIVEIYGKYGVITTLWGFNEDTLTFEYLKKLNSESCALDFNYLTNVNNILKYNLNNISIPEPDRYKFTYLVFDGIYSSLKNNVNTTKTYIYPNIMNKSSVLYNTLGNYDNELNLTIKYNDYVDGALTNTISEVSQTAKTKYFNTNYNTGIDPSTGTPGIIVTNTLYNRYQYSTTQYNEYVPNYNVPSLDLSEVLVRDETLLNRLNVLSFANNCAAYYSYIGTSFDLDSSKSTFRIGTSNTNINIGTATMIDESQSSSFLPQPDLSIDFENINLSGNTNVDNELTVNSNIVTTGVTWRKYENTIGENVITYWTTDYSPVGRYIYEVKDHYGMYNGIINLNSNTDTNIINCVNKTLYNYAINKEKLYTINLIPDNNLGKVYLGDGIYIPSLLNKLNLQEWIIISDANNIDMSNIVVTSNMNIIKYNNTPIILVSSSALLSDKYISHNYLQVTDKVNWTNTLIDTSNGIFTGNELTITYYISDVNKLNINIDENDSKPIITYVHKIKTQY